MADELQQLPTTLDPQRAAMLSALFPQAGPPAAGGAAPAAQGEPDLTQEMAEASREGRQAFGSQLQRFRQTMPAQGQYSEMGDVSDRPKASWLEPSIDPTTGAPVPQQGGFLHNLGRALQVIGLSTAPGHAIDVAAHQPALNRWREGYAARAEEMKNRLVGATEEEKMAGSAAGMVSKPITAASQVMKGEAAKTKADAYAQNVSNHFAEAMRGLDIKGLLAGSQVELNKARAALASVEATLAPQKLELEKYGIDTTNATRVSVANILSTMTGQKIYPWSSLVDNLLGTEVAPPAALGPGGAAPVGGSTTPPRAAKQPAASAAPARPSNVPADYIYKSNGPKGPGWYRPGSK